MKTSKPTNYSGLKVEIRPASKTSTKFIVWDVLNEQIFANEEEDDDDEDEAGPED